MKLLIASISVVVLACSNSSTERVVLRENGISYDQPEGYSTHLDHGAWVLAVPDREPKISIAIQAARNDDWSSDTFRGRAPKIVIPALRTALKALPDAVVGTTEVRSHPLYKAVETKVTFSHPHDKRKRYERRYVTLFGRSRVMHVILTGLEGMLEQATADFAVVVASIKEEG
jgi:hypothetical protein